MVGVWVPTGALRFAETVSVDLPEPVTDDGLKLALVRLGKALMLKLTVPENGPTAPIFTAYEVLEPRVTVWLVGVAEMVKSDGAFTTNVTLAV
jgi:hypothetical protein